MINNLFKNDENIIYIIQKIRSVLLKCIHYINNQMESYHLQPELYSFINVQNEIQLLSQILDQKVQIFMK